MLYALDNGALLGCISAVRLVGPHRRTCTYIRSSTGLCWRGDYSSWVTLHHCDFYFEGKIEARDNDILNNRVLLNVSLVTAVQFQKGGVVNDCSAEQCWVGTAIFSSPRHGLQGTFTQKP